MPRIRRILLCLMFAGAARAADDSAKALAELDIRVAAKDSEEAKQLSKMLYDDAKARRTAANQRSTAEWRAVKTREDWDKFVGPKIAALKESLGSFPEVGGPVEVKVTKTHEGAGYRIDCLLYQSRPGVWVTANLYRPEKPVGKMPGLVIIHSHHNPKTESELQDMGILWARAGCLVLVPDQVGHGERRTHGFRSDKDYPTAFRPSRQDYWFRYNTGMQLHLIGDSLTGWMVHDVRRGADLLLAQPGIDKDRLVVLGAVAGGGDPCAVTAAVEPRFAVAVPFNFGGPQPETTFPLPADPENAFNYAGGGSFESTRNLRVSARDGFLPWVIISSIAPRRLVYSHEFAWDRDNDPVWKRLNAIYALNGNADGLSFTHGHGQLSGRPPAASHCNNIGATHRKGIYAAFAKWFGLAAPEKEVQERRPSSEMWCVTPDTAPLMKPLHEVAGDLGSQRAEAFRKRLAALPNAEQIKLLRDTWSKLLGGVDAPAATVVSTRSELVGTTTVQRLLLQTEPGILVPAALMLPARRAVGSLVVMVAQEGKQELLKARAGEVAKLLDAGAAVCLVDLRGTGESRAGSDRGRSSSATSISSMQLLLGQTSVGLRVRDLRSVLAHLRSRNDLSQAEVGLWGDSLAAANAADANVAAPWDAQKLPAIGEPGAALVVLLTALFEDRVGAVHTRGGLASLRSVLDSPFIYIPHDVIVPGALTAGDVGDVVAALAPRAVRLDALIDGTNRPAKAATVKAALPTATDRLIVNGSDSPAEWLLKQLARN